MTTPKDEQKHTDLLPVDYEERINGEHFVSPSSALSEAEWCHIIGEAIRLAEGKADYAMYYEKYTAPKVYAAIKPHLSETSADKARVEGLVEALRKIAKPALDGKQQQADARDALAAFEKGD